MVARIFTKEDVKWFRFKAELISSGNFTGFTYQFFAPVRVHGSDGDLIGFAALSQEGDTLQASAITQMEFQDRLDIENGEKRYLKPVYKFDLVQKTVTVHCLTITNEPTSGGPIYGFQVE